MQQRIGTTIEIQMKIRTVLGETNAPTQSPQQAVTNKPNDIASNVKKNLAVKGAKIAKVKLNKDLSQCQSCRKDILFVNALNAIDLAIIFRQTIFLSFFFM